MGRSRLPTAACRGVQPCPSRQSKNAVLACELACVCWEDLRESWLLLLLVVVTVALSPVSRRAASASLLVAAAT